MTAKLVIQTIFEDIKNNDNDTTKKAKELIINIAGTDKYRVYEYFVSKLIKYYIKNKEITVQQYKALKKINNIK